MTALLKSMPKKDNKLSAVIYLHHFMYLTFKYAFEIDFTEIIA